MLRVTQLHRLPLSTPLEKRTGAPRYAHMLGMESHSSILRSKFSPWVVPLPRLHILLLWFTPHGAIARFVIAMVHDTRLAYRKQHFFSASLQFGFAVDNSLLSLPVSCCACTPNLQVTGWLTRLASTASIFRSILYPIFSLSMSPSPSSLPNYSVLAHF